MPDFSRLADVIQNGIDRNLHTGVQVYVSVHGQPVLDQGFGLAGPNQPMTSDTLMLWRSAGKPLTAAAICRLWQAGLLDLDAPLAQALPIADDTILRDISVRQILTHTTGLPIQDSGWPHQPWDRIIGNVLSLDGPSTSAAYQPQNTWFLLGELLRRMDSAGRSLEEILQQELLHPLGMHDTQCGVSNAADLQHRLPTVYTRAAGRLIRSDFSTGPWLSEPSLGGNFRGPVRELGRFYEMLWHNGRTLDGVSLLTPETVQQMTTRQRVGQYDETFQHTVDFGLGLIIDSNAHGVGTVPYGFSASCSPRTFGHGGAQCAMGFCDPDVGLVVVWAANGFCGEGQHQRRNVAINSAIYEAVC